MKLPEFRLERFFARWEFEADHLLCASDVEPLRQRELLDLADAELRALWDGLSLGYTESAGHPLLRAEIASLHEKLSPEGVLVCAGAEEAIFLAVQALLSAGDHVIAPSPAYQSLHEVARSTGADVSLLRLRPEAAWLPEPDELRGLIRPATRLVVLNFPHNPTGALPDADRFRALLDVAADAGAWVLSDEAYRFLEHEPADRLPTAADLYDRAISVGVLSKAFASAGLRIGWLACRDPAPLARAAALKDYTTICSSAPSEVLATIALRARAVVLARTQRVLEANLPLLRGFLDRTADRIACVPPRAGVTAFPRLLGGESARELADALVRETGVLIAPGDLFGGEDGQFRLGFGRRDFPEALARFEAFLGARVAAGS